MTPKHWRHVRIEPKTKPFRIVMFYTHIMITDAVARAAGFEGAKDFVGLTKKQALEKGEQMEGFMSNQSTRIKDERRINPTQNEDTDFKLES